MNELTRLRSGDEYGRFRILEALGEGAFARVFKVEAPDFSGPLALKVTHRPVTRKDIAQRMLREIAVLQKLDNPHVLRVRDAGTMEDGRAFILTDYLPGDQLNDLHDFDAPMPAAQAVDLIHQACQGVSQAHGAGIVHRDLKPDNIWVRPDGTVVVLDFGFARSWDEDSVIGKDATVGHMMVGTPHYTQPEQAVHAPLTPASDVYTLATVLYELLTGSTPFFPNESVSQTRDRLADDPVGWLEAHAKRDAIPLDKHDASKDLPPKLVEVVARSLDKDPNHRPVDAAELAVGLRTVLDILVPEERRTRTDGPTIRKPPARAQLLKEKPITESGPIDIEDDAIDADVDLDEPCPGCRKTHPESILRCPDTDVRLPLRGRLLEGKFRLIEPIGEGGMAFVWRARNLRVERDVAIKLIRSAFSKEPEAIARFHAEAKAAGRSRDPHIADVLDVGTSPIGPFIVMELLHGESLAERIGREGALEPTMLVSVIKQALIGLEAAHRAGIIHRDLKPENVYLHRDEDGETVVKLMDFGVSKFAHGQKQGPATREGILLGTPKFMAPEQLRGAINADARTDIWAIGAILYRGLTGRYAFDADDPVETMLKIRSEDPVPMASLAEGIPAGLVAVVERCMKREPDERFQSAQDLAHALQQFEETAPARVPDETSEPHRITPTTGKRTPLIPWLAGAVGLVVVGAIAIAMTRTPPEDSSDAETALAGAKRASGGRSSASRPQTVAAQPKSETTRTVAPSGGSTAATGGETVATGTGAGPTATAMAPPVPPPPEPAIAGGSHPPAEATPLEPEVELKTLQEVGPRGDQRSARRYCEGLAAKGHRGTKRWSLANPATLKKLANAKRGRYWTTAVHKGKAIVVSLPSAKSMSVPVARTKYRPLCTARVRVPVEG